MATTNYRPRHRAPSLSVTDDPTLPAAPAPTWPPMVGPSPSPPATAAGIRNNDYAEGDGPKAPPRETSSTPASTDKRNRDGVSLSSMGRRGLQEAAETGFRGLGEGLNELAAEERGIEDEPDDIWIPTDDEAHGFGQPTGRLIARRLPELPGGDADDAADVVAALIPVAIWAGRNGVEQLRRVAQRRRYVRQLAEAQAAAERENGAQQ